MAIPYPIPETKIASSQWGIPITDAANQSADTLSHLPGRTWMNVISQSWATTQTLLNGTNVPPGETRQRKWLVMLSLTIDPTDAGFPKSGGIWLIVNGVTYSFLRLNIPMAGVAVACQMHIGPVAITSCRVDFDNFRVANGQMIWHDSGP